MTAVTDGTLLDGRVRYRQPAAGHRSGLEPVLLAAAVPARPGDAVLELGTGAGAGLLCLAARVPGLRLAGIEADPGTAALARDNLAANGCSDATIATATIPPLPAGLDAPGAFAHAFANPPWHDPDGTAPPDPARDLARRRAPDTLAAWAGALAGAVRRGGTVTLIVPARLHPAAAAALAGAGCGELRLFPLWPREGVAARLCIVSGRPGRRGAAAILPGLVLHGAHGLTEEAERVLRRGEALRTGPGA